MRRPASAGLCRLNQTSLGCDSQLSRGKTVGPETQFGIIRKAALYRLCRRRHNQYLYCHPGAEGKLIQAKYFGTIRNDVALGDCSVNQLKLKADESDPTES
jgi:hypothetical protein